mgnify:CR=1 FL=1
MKKFEKKLKKPQILRKKSYDADSYDADLCSYDAAIYNLSYDADK